MEEYKSLVASYGGSIIVRSYPWFNAQVSTLDIKNGISEYIKLEGRKPDIVIIDSMDLLTDARRRLWGAEYERSKRIAVANDLKDLAADENVWMVVIYLYINQPSKTACGLTMRKRFWQNIIVQRPKVLLAPVLTLYRLFNQ